MSKKMITCPKCGVSVPAVKTGSTSIGRRFTIVKKGRFEKDDDTINLHCDLCGHRFKINKEELSQ